MSDVSTKVQKEYPDFCSEVDSLPPEALKARILQLFEQLEESEDHKEANEELKAARAAVNEMMGPYRDVRKAVKLKTQYLLQRLKDKGAAV